jgi:hypothetical protein
MANTSVKQICSSKRSVNSDRVSAYRTKQISLLFQVTLRGTVNVCTYWEHSDRYSNSLYRSADTFSFGTQSSHCGLDVFGVDWPDFLFMYFPKLRDIRN